MDKKRPSKKVVLKTKEKNGEGKHGYVDLVAIWTNDDGRTSLTLDRNIASITLADGREIVPSQYYVNVQERREHLSPTPRRPAAFESFED